MNDESFQTSIPKSAEDIVADLQKHLENKSDSIVVQEKWGQFESARSPVLDGGQRKNQSSASGFKTNIRHTDQPIPAEIDEFCACSEKKAQLQQFFIHWLRGTCINEKQVFLDVCHTVKETSLNASCCRAKFCER